MRSRIFASLGCALFLAACGGADTAVTTLPDAGHVALPDSGTADAGSSDAGALDAGSLDAGDDDHDAGDDRDAGLSDAGGGDDHRDAGTPDAGGSPDAGTLDGGAAPDAGTASDAGVVVLRVMNGNLTSGNDQAYEQPGIDIFAGAHPDIAMVQEFNVGGNTTAELNGFVTAAFGSDAVYFRESGSGFQIPNGIVSHYPILASGSFTDPNVSNRGFAWAEISLPNGKHLWAYSLHLLTSSATNRNSEAVALVADIQAQVPAGDYIAIGGDFNTATRSEACVTTLSAVTVTAGPYPLDNAGNDNTSTNRNEPHDWVLASSNLDSLSTAADFGTDSFAHGLVIDTRVYTPLTDLAPAVVGDSGASGMQHMGVVRDFALRLP
jgi:endonuclease/exonuclease/phosphatase family metal-dependent hydrolase